MLVVTHVISISEHLPPSTKLKKYLCDFREKINFTKYIIGDLALKVSVNISEAIEFEWNYFYNEL